MASEHQHRPDPDAADEELGGAVGRAAGAASVLERGGGALDPDTITSPGSWDAATAFENMVGKKMSLLPFGSPFTRPSLSRRPCSREKQKARCGTRRQSDCTAWPTRPAIGPRYSVQ
jgi:hypothetical protein